MAMNGFFEHSAWSAASSWSRSTTDRGAREHVVNTSTTPAPPSGFAPLRQTVFAVLWAATIIGNIGSFMRDVASAWLVTDLSGAPAAVALVQVAATLPVFLLAIPAGVLSDILDRRRFLIVGPAPARLRQPVR